MLAKNEKDSAELRWLTSEKYLIQKKIDDLIRKIYYNCQFFYYLNNNINFDNCSNYFSW